MVRTEIIATTRLGSTAMHLRFFGDVDDNRAWAYAYEGARRKLAAAIAPLQGAIVGAPADPEAFG